MYFENTDEMKDFLVDECEYDQESVDKMGVEEMLDKLLQWYGICGWTSTILEWIDSLQLQVYGWQNHHQTKRRAMTIKEHKQLPKDEQKKFHIDWLIAGLCIVPSLVMMIGMAIFM